MRPMIVQDTQIIDEDIVRLAQATATSERIERIKRWVAEGQIMVVGVEGHDSVRLRCDDVFFSEYRVHFPSINLIAEIALCLQAGYSDRNRLKIDMSDAMSYAIFDERHRVRPNELYDRMLETSYENVRKITATVKPPKKLAKVQP